LAMLNPLRTRAEEAGDDDLAGPLLFGMIMGSLHLLHGRVHFGQGLTLVHFSAQPKPFWSMSHFVSSL